MIKTTAMLLEDYQKYHSPKNKISRMAANGELIPIVRGLYETDRNVSGYLLAGCIYGPSYLSFEFALSRYGLIPEAVYVFTSATFGKKKKKQYTTAFGTYTFRDVPDQAFPLDIKIATEGEYTYLIASAEKALCDTLYAAPPVRNQSELFYLLFDDMRIDEQEFDLLDREVLIELSDKYHCINTKLLKNMLRRQMNGSGD